MSIYPKINSLYKRDERGRFIVGEFADSAFDYLFDADWIGTEKVDGTNIRVYWDAVEGDITIRGRTDNAQLFIPLLEAVDDAFDRSLLVEHFPDGATFYGEGYGARIQKGGGNYRDDQAFVLFDVRVGGWWLRDADLVDAAEELKLDVVPRTFWGRLRDPESVVREGFLSEWGNFTAEGLVLRPAEQLFDRHGNRITVKLKTRDFR